MTIDKIQTGLRIPEEQYERIKSHADRIGVSLNQLVLMMLDLGLSLFEQEECHHVASHDRKYAS